MWGLSWEHWVIVGCVLGLLFGVKRIPNAMGDLGKTIRQIRKLPDDVMGDDDARS